MLVAILVSIIAGFVAGAALSGWIFSEARAAKKQVMALAQIAQANFQHLHNRVIELEKKAGKLLAPPDTNQN